MDVVMVEFAVGPPRSDACVAALTELTRMLVARQPAFHDATIHVGHATGMVVNGMRRDRAADFFEFRDADEDVIGRTIGELGPRPRSCTVAAEIAPEAGA